MELQKQNKILREFIQEERSMKNWYMCGFLILAFLLVLCYTKDSFAYTTCYKVYNGINCRDTETGKVTNIFRQPHSGRTEVRPLFEGRSKEPKLVYPMDECEIIFGCNPNTYKRR